MTDTLPRADASEDAAIGAMILSPERLTEAIGKLRPADFFNPCHRALAEIVFDMHAADEPVELSTIRSKVVSHPALASIDAVEFLCRVLQDAVTSKATFAYHVKQIIEAAHKRRLVLIGDQIAEAAKSGEDVSSIAAESVSVVTQFASDLESTNSSDSAAFTEWESSVLNREKPELFVCASYGSKLRQVPIGEGLVTLIGAPPGAGKTALVVQLTVDALQAPEQEHLKALIANVEMSPQSIWNRQLARITGVGHQWIQHRDFDDEATERLRYGIDELRQLLPRLEFLKPPFTLERLSERSAASGSKIVVVDYAQRFDFQNRSTDQRSQTSGVMDVCRRIADQGRAVIVVSAVNRQGYSKESAGLASFRESSELEYGADAAYLLIQDEQDGGAVTLKCVKHRHGSLVDIPLVFDGARQSFTDDMRSYEWTG